ncbi:MAG: sugar phosphate nucleotidyltransferase [bacterium]
MTRPDELIGVILAAGMGTRMHPFEKLPKPLLPILNRPLLSYQLDHMARLGIKKLIIVVGYYGFEIVRRIGDGSELGLEIEYVHQEQTLGIAHAVGELESRIDRPFVLFLGDVYFRCPDLSGLVLPLLSGEANAVLAATREENIESLQRNFAILTNEDGSVKKVMEKPRHPATNLKGCGLYAFDLHIFDAVRRTPRTAARDEYEITESIELLIQDGFRVTFMEDVIEDSNLTYPSDLLDVNQRELSLQGRERWIGEDFNGPPPSNVKNSVIGDRVRIPPSIKVSNSLIFSDVVIEDEHDLDWSILTPKKQFSFSERTES